MSIKKLKETLVRKDLQTWKEEGKQHQLGWGPKGTRAKMCLERARFLTESYKKTEGHPEVLRAAKALKHILENMTIYIRDGECVVGNFASDISSMSIQPELSTEWLEREVEGQWSYLLDEDGHKEFKEIMDYWRDKCIDAKVQALLPDELKKWITYKGSGGVVSADEYQVDRAWPQIDYEKAFRIGLAGIIKEAEERLSHIQGDLSSGGTDTAGWVEQNHFLKALILSCRAVISFANRFATLAEELAEKEEEQDKKKELLEIAGNCRQVPEHPPSSLHQAMQAWWFLFLVTHLIESTGHGSPCRFDQIMYPFYKKDKAEGKVTREKAQELVEYIFMKNEEIGQITLPSIHVTNSGSFLSLTFTIGGTDKSGKDASNEFSFIILDACMSFQSAMTDIALRYHPRINHDLVLKALDCIRTGVGYPAFFNDATIVPWLLDRGVPLDLARTYQIPACVTVGLPGKNCNSRIVNGCFVAMAKCLELALNEGKDFRSERQLGCVTPDPLIFTSVEDVMDAYLKQLNYAIDKVAKINNVAQELYRLYAPRPFTSALIDGCIEKGMDCTAWTEYPYHHMIVAGPVNVADSLAAMKKLVFEEEVISMRELIQALKDNFEGHEEMRQKLINDAPKYGNDQDDADLLLREVMHRSQEEAEKFTDLWGHPWTLDSSIAGGYYAAGRATWALPDGKKEGRVDTYADGTLSPAAGRDKKGPTAVINSMSKIDPPFSVLCNQKFMPQFLEGENKEMFASYIKSWAEMGNWHIQFNVVEKEILYSAQKEPEKHSDLVVRVAGYSAYFVDLPRELQEDIIARTPQSFSCGG